MAVPPLYPADLPRPLSDGYQFARGDGRIVFANASGPPSIRRRTSAEANTVQFSTFLSRAKLARFDRFFEDDTKKGTLPFLLPDPGTDGWPLAKEDTTPLLTHAGVPILVTSIWLVTFGGKLPVVTNRSMYFTVSFEVTVLP